jgi:hypothetical protein
MDSVVKETHCLPYPCKTRGGLAAMVSRGYDVRVRDVPDTPLTTGVQPESEEHRRSRAAATGKKMFVVYRRMDFPH